MQKGRYIRPISGQDIEALIGLFQSSPLSIIPKTEWVGKSCNIQNYSFLIAPSNSFPNFSINSHVDSDSYPTTWGIFTVVSSLICQLLLGSQLATRDIAEAYCTISLHYSQWPSTVVWLEDNVFAINMSLCFRSSPSTRMYVPVQNATSDILQFQSIRPISS